MSNQFPSPVIIADQNGTTRADVVTQDGLNRLAVTVSGGTSQPTAWTSAFVEVPTPGTAVQCPDITVPEGVAVVFKARSTNTDTVYIGNSQANAEDDTLRVSLNAGQAALLYISNANLVWVDALVADEGVEVFVEQS